MYFEIISNLERKWQEGTKTPRPPQHPLPPENVLHEGALHVCTPATLPSSAAEPMPTTPEPTTQDPLIRKAMLAQTPRGCALRGTPL